MNLVVKTLLDEKKRIEFMIDKYQNILTGLPKGNLYERNINGRTYCYLKYRDGKKVVSKYIPLANKDDILAKIEKRQHIISMIDSLKAEMKTANKMLEVNSK